MIGTPQRATQAVRAHYADYYTVDTLTGWQVIGAGAHRTVYRYRDEQTVYKVGSSSANRYEADRLAELRARGLSHAPACTLHTVTIAGLYRGEGGPEWETQYVVAMPYLPEDGSVPSEDRRDYLEGAADLNPTNIHAHHGQLWLIDAAGVYH